MRSWLIIAALALSLFAGCKKRQAPPPTPVTLPPPIVPSQEPVVVAPSVKPAAPGVPTQAPPPEIVPAKPGPLGPPPAPAAKPVRRVRTPRRPPPAPVSPAPPPPQEKPESPPSRPPQLGELLDQTAAGRYRQQYETSLASARESLESVAARELNPAQANTAARIRSFIQESEKLHETDIRSAAQLASRAASLGRDLVSSLK